MFHIGVATQHPPLPDPGQLSDMGIDFIRQCLTIDPVQRPTAVELMDHPWMQDFAEALRNFQEAEALQLKGTPVYLVGPFITATPLDLPQFKQIVADAREDQAKPASATTDEAPAKAQ